MKPIKKNKFRENRNTLSQGSRSGFENKMNCIFMNKYVLEYFEGLWFSYVKKTIKNRNRTNHDHCINKLF